jgi:hypothetical protein
MRVTEHMFGEHMFDTRDTGHAEEGGSSVQWVCYIEVQGLYAEAARAASLAPEGRPVVVLRSDQVYDGCKSAFAGGLVLGAPSRQVLCDLPGASRVELEQIEAESDRRARSWWDRSLAHTPYVEPVDRHQLFLALPTPGAELMGALRREVQQLVEQAASFGFVAFAGVAPSRLVARAAALACKERWLLWRPGKGGRGDPPTLAFVRPGEEAAFLAPLPVEWLPAPPDLRRRLVRLGFRTIGEAARIPEGEWLRQLGPAGAQVAGWCRGVDPEPVKAAYPPRTLERRVEFAPEVRDRDLLEQAAGRMAAELSRRLADRGEGCQQVALTLHRPDGPPVRAERVLPRLQQAAYPLQQALRILLNQALAEARRPEGVPVAALTVELGLIAPMPLQQMSLWDQPGKAEREERLQRALSLLHERFPPRVVGLGPRRTASWREQMLGFSDPYRWVAR